MPFGFCFSKIFLIPVHSCFKLLDVVASNVLVVFHHLVDNAVGGELDDAVGYGFDELVVMAREQDVAFEQFQVVVESLDALQIQMVCRSVQNEAVGAACGLSCSASSLLLKAR